MFETVTENELHVEPLVDGVRLVLPRRDLGEARRWGWVVMIPSLVGLVLMCAWMAFFVVIGVLYLRQGEAIGWFVLCLALLGFWPLPRVSRKVMLGLTILADRTQCTVEAKGQRLIVSERLLLGSWRQAWPLAEIEGIRIVLAPHFSATSPREETETVSRAEEVASNNDEKTVSEEPPLALSLKRERALPVLIASDYPRHLLVSVLEKLNPHIATNLELPHALQTSQEEIAPQPVVQIAESGEDRAEREFLEGYVREQPRGSTLTIDRNAEGVVISCPPRGVWMAAKGMVLFTLFCNGVIAMLLMAFFLVVLGDNVNSDVLLLLGVMFLVLVVPVGIGLIVGAVRLGGMQTNLAVAGGRLLVTQESVFGRKVREWPAEELEAIRLGERGNKPNDRPITELKIVAKNGSKTGLLSDREDDEISWVAGELTRALGLGKPWDVEGGVSIS